MVTHTDGVASKDQSRRPNRMKFMRSSISIARALVFLPLFAAALPAQNNRLAGRIDTRHTVALKGNVNPIAQPQFDEGAADSVLKLDRITLLLKPSGSQQAALEQLLAEQQDPSSPNYHHWLTPEQYADRFGLSPADIGEILSWLQSQGFIVEEVARGRNWIAFSGTAGLVERAFATQIHHYRRDGELHFANAAEPSIPTALDPLVLGLRGLDDVHPKPAHMRRRPAARWVSPQFNFGGGHDLAPDDVAVIYDLNPLYGAGFDGTGLKIVIPGQSRVDLTDINTFRSIFHLSVNTPQTVLAGTDPGIVTDALQEADLDLEWAGAVARGATLVYVYSTDVWVATQTAINQNLAPIISWSYGTCEVQNSPGVWQSFRSLAQQAAAQGITWVASSGDSGPADCDAHGDPNTPVATQGISASLPASVPEVTGVGGTRFNEGAGNYWSASNGSNWGSALSYIPETSWNDSSFDGALSASGGGASIAFSKPAWQSGAGVPNDGARDVPDVSLSASADHDGYVVCTGGSCAGAWPPQQLWVFGGTSASAPSFAGMLALLQQYLIANHFQSTPGLGNINPTLYRLAQNASSVFHDIQSGNNIVPCAAGSPNCPPSNSFGFTAGPGYDQVTGLGSVDGNSLITNWHFDLCTYSVTPPSATVPPGANSGSVTLTTQSWCSWNALSGANWLTITSSASGIGPGSVGYSVTANNASSPRTGALHIGGQTFTVTQNGTTPVLSITKTHNGSFTRGQQGAVYTVIVSNGANAGPTSGTVTVTETAPSGLTLVSMSGTGWTCPGTAANNCTRSTVLGAGASYPAITVAVNVASNAPSQVTNQVSVSGGGSATANASDITAINPNIAPTGLYFVPMTPCRVADTRNTPNGPFSGPSLGGGTSRDFIIPSSACGIPPSAMAYSLNVTVVPQGSLGYLTVWPSGQARPLASTLNSLDGRIKANAAIVPAGTGGAVSVYATNATDLVLDINGYFVPNNTASTLAFYPLTPCRVADTRTNTGPLGGPSLSGGQSRTFPALSSSCNGPSSAQAYSLNFTAVPSGPLGYLTAWPTGQVRPLASTLNALTGAITANAAIIPAGTSGSVDVYVTDATNLVIDINGYFAPAGTGGLSLYNLTPCRVLDTRQPPGSQPFSGEKDVNVTGSGCGAPAAAQAYVFNATVVPPGGLGYLTLWPQGLTQPVVSTLNALDGAITSNMAIVPTANGSIAAFPSNPTHLVLDIFGYFAP